MWPSASKPPRPPFPPTPAASVLETNAVREKFNFRRLPPEVLEKRMPPPCAAPPAPPLLPLPNPKPPLPPAPAWLALLPTRVLVSVRLALELYNPPPDTEPPDPPIALPLAVCPSPPLPP